MFFDIIATTLKKTFSNNRIINNLFRNSYLISEYLQMILTQHDVGYQQIQQFELLEV